MVYCAISPTIKSLCELPSEAVTVDYCLLVWLYLWSHKKRGRHSYPPFEDKNSDPYLSTDRKRRFMVMWWTKGLFKTGASCWISITTSSVIELWPDYSLESLVQTLLWISESQMRTDPRIVSCKRSSYRHQTWCTIFRLTISLLHYHKARFCLWRWCARHYSHSRRG